MPESGANLDEDINSKDPLTIILEYNDISFDIIIRLIKFTFLIMNFKIRQNFYEDFTIFDNSYIRIVKHLSKKNFNPRHTSESLEIIDYHQKGKIGNLSNFYKHYKIKNTLLEQRVRNILLIAESKKISPRDVWKYLHKKKLYDVNLHQIGD